MNRLDEIRARYKHSTPVPLEDAWINIVIPDVAFLLAEVERLVNELARVLKECAIRTVEESNLRSILDSHYSEVERLTSELEIARNTLGLIKALN